MTDKAEEEEEEEEERGEEEEAMIAFDPELAGSRMRLPIPTTWETQLSEHGNTTQTWERLIDESALPFMAMLRNLRNIILANVSDKHHDAILARLRNERQVQNSRHIA